MSTSKEKTIHALLVNKLYHPVIGGVETHVRDLAVHLPASVERKVLVCSEERRRKVELIDGIEVIKAFSLGVFFSSPLPVFFGRELKTLSSWADLFHFHFPFPPGEVSFLLTGIRKPLVVTYHSDIVRQKALLKAYQPFLMRFLDRADAIVATSPSYVETSPYLSRFKEKCVVIPLGIDTSLYERSEKTQEMVETVRRKVGAPFVLFVGRLIYYKGVEYLVRAFKKVPEPYRLVIIGRGPLEEKLKKEVAELNLSGRVVFVKPLPFDELLAFYHACELFVLPSVERSEAFGIVLLEAQACRKPVVSTELGTGTSYANRHGHTGLVVPPADEDALAGAITELLRNDGLRERYGRNAYRRVRQEFDVKVMARRVADLYSKVLS